MVNKNQNNKFSNMSDWLINEWQKIADLLGIIIGVPAALIMRTENEYMEIFVSSKTENNPYHVGDKEKWHGLYCETVIKSQKKLLIPNALKDKNWDKNPDIKLGMTAYLGYPINFPDNTPFGTICVLDNKENEFSKAYKQLLLKFRDIIESDLLQLHTFDVRTEELSKTIVEQNKALKIAKDKAEKSELNYKLLSDLTFEGIIIIHDNGVVIDINLSLIKLLGYSEKELLEMTLFDVLKTPFDKNKFRSICPG